MTSKRGRFMTVIFSFIPGAGHMYMGFMKTGVSLMTVFFADIFLSAVLNLGILLYAMPIIWFYAFFDCINKMSLPDEAFKQEKDRYLFSLDTIIQTGLQIKYRLYLGISLVIVGFFILWNNLWPQFSQYFIVQIRDFIFDFNHILPQIVASVIIIFIGAKLIAGRKREDGHV